MVKQPTRKIIKKKKPKSSKKESDKEKKSINETPLKYGISKLEKDFAHEFLDKNGIKYIYEFEAKDIKRFYDFAIITKSGEYVTENKHGLNSVVQGVQHTPIDFLIEVDGQFWHADPRFVNEDKLTITQKRNKRVDEIKNKWAESHSIPLLRIWEYDIRHNPKKVIEELRKFVHIPENSVKNKAKKRVMKLK